MEKSIIFGFISSLKSCLLNNPNMNHLQINKRLQFLGWDDFELDYHTLQLAKACLRANFVIMRRTYRTLNDCEMQHNAEVGLFTKPSKLETFANIFRLNVHHLYIRRISLLKTHLVLP
ncbi:MAG: hypothetical protein JRJ62_10355 [Deltaproteobacteria bacterium]|nr:hypothetical protein [Deltaproteobacteria bacterium]